MTETSPVAVGVHARRRRAGTAPEAEQADLRASVGRITFGVECRVVEPDTTTPVPRDGEVERRAAVPRATGSRPRYYDDPRAAESFTDDGWLRTGDVATMDGRGRIRLVDRTKDLIKSGGEWISSVELENELMAHPQIREAAVIGVPDPTLVGAAAGLRRARSTGADARRASDVLDYLADRVAKWQLPDDVVFIDEVPKTSVGKFSKKTLRERFAEYELPV